MGSVAVEKIVKVFGSRAHRVRALDGVSISIADGEFVALVGPSGCGKTTTLRIIAGLESPDEGTVRVADRIVNDLPPKDRDVAMVFQNYALYPHMTVYKNLAFGLTMRGVARAEIDQKVITVAEMLGVTPLLNRRPHTLSGGEQQRVALGRAIVREPQAFLLDEPLSNLDATLRTQLRSELKALHQRLGATVIHVTHDQEEAMTLGDRLVVMNRGVVHQCGTPMEVYSRPANRFVATFIGRPAMSVLRGRVEIDNGRTAFRCPGGVHIEFPRTSSGDLHAPSDKDVLLGVRAEHIRPMGIDTDSSGGMASIPVTVTLVEPMGDRTYIHAATESGDTLVARTGAYDATRPGDRLRFALDTTAIHLFSSDRDEVRLGGPAIP